MLDQINEEIKTSLKSGDKFKLSVLRMLKSALQNESISLKKELTNEEIEIVVKRQVKMRNDSLTEYTKYGKNEEIETLNKEIEILLTYLPKQLTDEEIKEAVDKLFQEVKPSGMKDMGACMKYASENIKNADMSKVSSLIKDKLK